MLRIKDNLAVGFPLYTLIDKCEGMCLAFSYLFNVANVIQECLYCPEHKPETIM